jgi:hypothetical protein
MSESESELLYDWLFTANQFVLATIPWDSRPALSFQLNTCFHGPYVTSPLKEGWVCSLQLLLALASGVILRSDSRGTRDHILLSLIVTSPKWRVRSPYFYPQQQGGPVIPPGTGFPFRRLLRLAGIRPRLHTEDNPCQIHYRYLITWDQAMSKGDNTKICNINCDKASTGVEPGQKGRQKFMLQT